MTDSEDDFDDDDDVGEFGDVERELYSSLIPQPKSNVAVLNALAAQVGLIGQGEWITEEMRTFAGAIIERCARNAYKAVEVAEVPQDYVEREMLPEPLEEIRKEDSYTFSKSKVALLNGLAADAGLIEQGAWITGEMRRFAGAVIKRCAWHARLALLVDESPSECVQRGMKLESLEEARQVMADYWHELDEELQYAGGGNINDGD
ncbi:hypothetical protein [Comamonas thiooxydans]|uniref:hypothetical protein n=1 Tax=Comamonas thiooxydans TaxID=363952 RepID=UPI0001BB11E9|nr:hypothetical protein [Comamonas thiooxydans]ACY33374.1 hypothetical protein CtCNB1_2628 [Comamonas thiooxydans]MDO1476046.1 hypothetical protein [Comamonas thiooxydans]